MVNDFIYSPNSRLTKFRQACNLNTEFCARKSLYGGLFIRNADEFNIGYIYYDTDSNTSFGFIFATRFDYYNQVQEFKSYFSKCIRLFRIRAKTVHYSLNPTTWTYYRVDATEIFHANKS